MMHLATRTRLAGVLIGAVVAWALVPGASAAPRFGNKHTDQVSATRTADPGIYVYPAEAAPAAEQAAARADLATTSRALEPPPAADDGSVTGFDWPSAGIGAGAAGLLLTLMVATGTSRRGQRTLRT
jgi:hypothetical protein